VFLSSTLHVFLSDILHVFLSDTLHVFLSSILHDFLSDNHHEFLSSSHHEFLPSTLEARTQTYHQSVKWIDIVMIKTSTCQLVFALITLWTISMFLLLSAVILILEYLKREDNSIQCILHWCTAVCRLKSTIVRESHQNYVTWSEL